MENNIQENELISKTIDFVKQTLQGAESGHDWYHVNRVWKNSIKISEEEKKLNPEIKINNLTLQLGALLHDIADHKFHGGDINKGPKVAREYLEGLKVDEKIIEGVVYIIQNNSYKGSSSKDEMDTIEGKIVQDSDRLDALGAIGIARVFSYSGFKKRPLYDPEDKPKLSMSWEEYKSNTGSAINHFYEKLLLIKDRMHTISGKKLAEERHNYMKDFLNQFYNEWDAC